MNKTTQILLIVGAVGAAAFFGYRYWQAQQQLADGSIGTGNPNKAAGKGSNTNQQPGVGGKVGTALDAIAEQFGGW